MGRRSAPHPLTGCRDEPVRIAATRDARLDGMKDAPAASDDARRARSTADEDRAAVRRITLPTHGRVGDAAHVDILDKDALWEALDGF